MILVFAANRLRRFVAENLAQDEREIAAAVVRGRSHVFRSNAEGVVIEMTPVDTAWDDLPIRRRILGEHASPHPSGACSRCGDPWPCSMLRTFLTPWAHRPGFPLDLGRSRS